MLDESYTECLLNILIRTRLGFRVSHCFDTVNYDCFLINVYDKFNLFLKLKGRNY